MSSKVAVIPQEGRAWERPSCAISLRTASTRGALIVGEGRVRSPQHRGHWRYRFETVAFQKLYGIDPARFERALPLVGELRSQQRV